MANLTKLFTLIGFAQTAEEATKDTPLAEWGATLQRYADEAYASLRPN